jgi:hypothetical protein
MPFSFSLAVAIDFIKSCGIALGWQKLAAVFIEGMRITAQRPIAMDNTGFLTAE